MAKGNKTGAIVILAILALGGLGLSGYMFIEDQFLGGNEYVPDHEHEDVPYHEHDYEDKSYKLVGLWDELDGVGDNFNISFSHNITAENEYVTLTGGTTFNLTQQGWYKFTIVTIFISLDSLNYYYVRTFRNGAISELIGYVHEPGEPAVHQTMEYYIYSSGSDLIYFTCGSSLGDSFGLTTNQFYNRAILEYVVSV